MQRTIAIGLLMFSVGCRKIEEAPADVDGLSRWFWVNYDDAEDAEIDEAVLNLHTSVGVDALELGDPVDGTLTDLLPEDIDHVEVPEGTDVTLAAGMFLVNVIDCPLVDVEKIITALNQDELYTGNYDGYERTYTSDDAAYFARTTPQLTWDVEIDSKLLGSKYHESIKGGTRFAVETAESAHGSVLLSRTYMHEPAVFESGNKTFNQDYQMEIFYERAPGETVHLFGLWREFNMGSGLDQDNTTVQRTVLNALADWDDDTAEICAAGGF